MRERSTRRGRAYAAIPNAAMRDRRISIEARGLLALLMTYADDWVFHRDHLMEMVGMGKDRFGRVMGELIATGYVRIEYVRADGGRLSGKTWVICDDATDVREMPTSVPTDVRENRRPVKPSSGKTAPIRRPTDQEDQPVRTLFDPIGSQSPVADAPASQHQSNEVDHRFDEFWSAYPRRLEKKGARAKFAAAVKAGADPAQIVAGAKRYAAHCERERIEERYRKHPTTWLNNGCWDDELPGLPRAPAADIAALEAEAEKYRQLVEIGERNDRASSNWYVSEQTRRDRAMERQLRARIDQMRAGAA